MLEGREGLAGRSLWAFAWGRLVLTAYACCVWIDELWSPWLYQLFVSVGVSWLSITSHMKDCTLLDFA